MADYEKAGSSPAFFVPALRLAYVAADYADTVHAALPTPPEFHTVPGADHFDFPGPCAAPAAMPMLCHSTAPFNRSAFHARFDADIVRFFTQTLMRNQS